MLRRYRNSNKAHRGGMLFFNQPVKRNVRIAILNVLVEMRIACFLPQLYILERNNSTNRVSHLMFKIFHFSDRASKFSIFHSLL